jgi:hypothetical protein
VAGKVFGGAAIAGVAGEVIKDLHEGKPGKAIETVGIVGAVTYVLKRNPELLPLAIMAGTIDAYDETVKEHANSAGSWVERKTGHRYIAATAASGTAVGESVFNSTFKPVGTAIGQGAAVVYIRLTSDEYTLKPWKAAWWPL